MNEHEVMLKYIYLQDLYRKRNFKNIPDQVINGIHVNDYFIFPKNWLKIEDYEYRIYLMEKSLQNNVPIEMLTEMQTIDIIETNEKMKDTSFDNIII